MSLLEYRGVFHVPRVFPRGEQIDPGRGQVIDALWDQPPSVYVQGLPEYWKVAESAGVARLQFKAGPKFADRFYAYGANYFYEARNDPEGPIIGTFRDEPSSGVIGIVLPPGSPIEALKAQIAEAIKACLGVEHEGVPIRVDVLSITMIEKFIGTIKSLDKRAATVCLYDQGNSPAGTVCVPKEDLDAQSIPFEVGTVFEFLVEQVGSAERFTMRHLPGVKLTPEEMALDDARIAEAVGEE